MDHVIARDRIQIVSDPWYCYLYLFHFVGAFPAGAAHRSGSCQAILFEEVRLPNFESWVEQTAAFVEIGSLERRFVPELLLPSFTGKDTHSFRGKGLGCHRHPSSTQSRARRVSRVGAT